MKREDLSPQWEGLGKKVEKPAPSKPMYRPADGIDPDKRIEQDKDGRLRTNDPRNEVGM